MSVTFAGISAARRRLAEVVAGLHDAASGAVVERAATKVQEQVAAVSRRVLGAHVLSGAAQSSASVTHAGGLVQLSTIGYPKFHAWWPFRSGMPPFVVTRAVKIFAAELAAAVGGQRSPLAVAEEAAEEAAAEKSRAKFKKDVARIYRQSDEGKAARRAAAKDRALDRAHEKRVKALEDRE